MAKTWGPFSGNHLVAIVGLITLTVGLPGTLWAVSTSPVTITNPATGKQALVTPGGALFVSGTVAATTSNLLNTFRASTGVGGCAAVATPATGKALLVQSIALTAYDVVPSGGFVTLKFGWDCDMAGILLHVDFPQKGPEVLQFEPGIVVPNGQSLLASASGATSSILVTGFQLPSASVPASGSTRLSSGADGATAGTRGSATR